MNVSRKTRSVNADSHESTHKYARSKGVPCHALFRKPARTGLRTGRARPSNCSRARAHETSAPPERVRQMRARFALGRAQGCKGFAGCVQA